MRRLGWFSAAVVSTLVAAVLTVPAAQEPAAAQSTDVRTADVTWNDWSFTYDVSDRYDGISLNAVNFRGVRFFHRIALPVMTVFYEDNACGPFADRLGGTLSGVEWAGGRDVVLREFSQNGEPWLEVGIQDQIGNYVIYQVFYLSASGEIDAHIFGKGLQCSVDHEHFPFWRIDIDIDGPRGDRILRALPGGGETAMTSEFDLAATAAEQHGWAVEDAATGYRVDVAFDDGSWNVPGTVVPESSYAENIVSGRAFGEDEAGPWSLGATDTLGYNSDASIDTTDVVLWYRGFLPHLASEGPALWHSTGVRMTLTLGGNTPPTIAPISDRSDQAGSSVTVPVATTDGDGDTVSLAASGLPPGVSVQGDTLAGTPTTPGTFAVTVTADDGEATASTSFTWTVTDPPPVDGLAGGPGGTVARDEVGPEETVVGVTVRSGAWLDAVQLLGEAGPLPQRGGDGGAASTVSLPGGDGIVRISGAHDGRYVTSLEFETANGLTHGPFGGVAGTESFAFLAPEGEVLTGLETRSGRYLNAIGPVWGERIGGGTVSEVVGGTGGTPFSDTVSQPAAWTGLSVRHGAWIDAVTVHTAQGDLPRRGGPGGTEVRWDLPAGDPVVEVFGEEDDVRVTQLGLRTAGGRIFGPVGTNPGTPFSLTAPPGQAIVGLHGRSSWDLDAIGIVTAAAAAPTPPPPVEGGPGGNSFYDLAGEPLTALTVRSGAWIDGVMLATASGSRSLHGGSGGQPTTWVLAEGEGIVSLFGSHDGRYVTELGAVTSTGRVLGPVGVPGPQPLSFDAPAGEVLVGLRGRSGSYLNAVGSLWGTP